MKKFVILLFLLISYSCATTSQKTQTPTDNQSTAQEVVLESSAGKGPKYEGKVYVIRNPISAKFKPRELHGKYNLFDNAEEDHIEVNINQSSSELESTLKWDVEYQGAKSGDFSIKGSLLTDEYGNFIRLEAPFLIKEDSKDGNLKDMGNFLFYSSFNMFLPKFNPKPAKSGDVFYSFIDLHECFGEIQDEEMKVKISPSKITAVLKGWANEGEKEVLVAEIHGKSKWRDFGENPISMEFEIRGYSLVDPVTFHVIKAEISYFVMDIPGDDDPMRISYSAEIE